MKVDQFIEQKKSSWNRLSELIKLVDRKGLKEFNREKLLELGNLYRQASSDLSYARANFKDIQIINYLNQLVARAHSQIYLPEPFNGNKIFHFYWHNFPDLFRQTLSYILLSAVIFVLSAITAFGVVKTDSSTTGFFIPDDIVAPMEKGLKEKEVGAKFPTGIAPMLSSQIMTNNISVGFRAFAFGITLGTGTIYVLIFNGFMLGSLAAVFNTYHYDLEFWTLILPHGIMELLAIFICGGAGLLLADAILNPKDLRRIDALKVNGNKAINLTLGVIPMFITAGLIEGFITPMEISPYVKLSFSLLTVIVLILYFLPKTWFRKKNNKFNLSGALRKK